MPIIGATEREMYQRHTGRATTPKKQAREAFLVVGRRGGKSFVVALVATYLACFRDYSRYLAPGERGVVMCLAADKAQARVVFRYIRALLENVPMLSRMVERVGMESIDLSNSVTLQINAASFRTTRGHTVCAAIADELAFWHSDESANPDREILQAIRPAMSTIQGALLLCLSSPYSQRGALWEAYQQHYGHDGDVLVWKAPTEVMNPTVSRQVIAKAYADDPVAAASEFGAEFRNDISGFLDPDLINSAVLPGVHELSPTPATAYKAAVDPSGGRNDSFALALAHPEGKRLVLDVCRARRAPFDPRAVVEEYAHVLKQYGCFRVLGDRYSAEWVVSAFREHGIQYDTSERSASDIFLECLPHFTTGAVQLLDSRTLLNELRQLERRTGRGKDLICHPAHGHDDAAVAACSALLQCAGGTMTAEEFDKGAVAIPAGAGNAERDQHLAEMGLVDLGEASLSISPFNDRSWE